ncbi:MAG: universal stress protein [Bryobacteraceae bacterium]|jgi:nucleotide-binding universal stress UspA family protein
MLSFKHILFPVDLSEQCATVAPFVQAWATHFRSRVTLLNALEMPPVYYAESTAFIGSVNVEAMLEERRRRLESFAPESFRNLEVQKIVRMGVTTMTILDFVRCEGVDLIMMPTHGYGPFRRFLLGSVAAKVLHDAGCPVWTSVHAQQPASASSPTDCRSVLCAVDLTAKSVGVIQWAKQLADSYGATLRLVHAVAGWPEANEVAAADEFRTSVFDFASKEIEKLQQQSRHER